MFSGNVASLYLIFLLGKKQDNENICHLSLFWGLKELIFLKYFKQLDPTGVVSLNGTRDHHHHHHHLPRLPDLFTSFRGAQFLIQRTHKILKFKETFTANWISAWDYARFLEQGKIKSKIIIEPWYCALESKVGKGFSTM